MEQSLVTSLTSRERMDMVQKGFLPYREEDIIRYRQGEKPTGEVLEFVQHGAGEGFAINTLGEKNVKGKFDFRNVDLKKKEQYFGEYDINSFESQIESPVSNVDRNPKGYIAEKMNDYTNNNSSTLDSKINNLVNKVQARTPSERTKAPSVNSQPQPVKRTPLNTPRNILKEEEVVANGYKDGVKYLNAFIRLLKEPTAANREILIEAINTFITTENNLPTQLLEVYRKGLSNAENKVYEQIKATKKNG